MKQYLVTVPALVCVVLVICLVATKRSDHAQHESDTSAITDFSNHLDSAQTEIAVYKGRILTFSNRLDESLSAALTFSNQLTEAHSAITLDMEQITSLNRQVAEVESENQTLSRHVTDLTGQMTNQISQIADLTSQITSTKTNLDQANKDYALLENRFRIDVAERVVAERKFNNFLEVRAQLRRLEKTPGDAVSAESIYAGLDMEVTSNKFHVISPN